MTYKVFLSTEAEADLLEIWTYVAIHDSQGRANQLFDNLKSTCFSLEEFPDRGHCPPELARIHVREYAEIHFKPYRVIYRIDGQKVFIHAIFDGRRNLHDILLERMLRISS